MTIVYGGKKEEWFVKPSSGMSIDMNDRATKSFQRTTWAYAIEMAKQCRSRIPELIECLNTESPAYDITLAAWQSVKFEVVSLGPVKYAGEY